jgi:2-C-methyl-D-erythritol 4-phosphate cytidylyltransferase
VSAVLCSNKCWAIIPAAGVGSRMGVPLPKQYLKVAGATVLEHSLSALLACDFIEKVIVALNPLDNTAASVAALRDPRVLLVEGGESRSDSVLAGLAALRSLAQPDDWVLVHDAARPCIAPGDISALAQQVCSSGVGGILAVPMVDTVKHAGTDNIVDQTLPRDELWCAQTPQMFRFERLYSALKSATQQGLVITDEASAMELQGERVQLVAGSVSNLKLTMPDDLPLIEFYLAQKNADTHL